MKKYLSAAAAAVTLVLAGCVSYSYTGEKAPAGSAEAQVYTDSAKIDFPYQVLGKAVVSGSYQQVSRDRMIAKLKSEAQECGAAGICISGAGPTILCVADHPDFPARMETALELALPGWEFMELTPDLDGARIAAM